MIQRNVENLHLRSQMLAYFYRHVENLRSFIYFAHVDFNWKLFFFYLKKNINLDSLGCN